MTSTPDCTRWREALSARADGEALPVEAAAVEHHLAACPGCAAFASDVDRLTRRVRIGPAEAVPDLTAAILSAVDTPDAERARARFDQLRGLLALVGVLQLTLAVPALAAAGDLASHVTREVGIFGVALGIGFLVAARRPEQARGLLPVAGVAAGLAVLTSLGDLATGATTVLQETAHLLEVVGTGLLWALDRRRRRPALVPAAV